MNDALVLLNLCHCSPAGQPAAPDWHQPQMFRVVTPPPLPRLPTPSPPPILQGWGAEPKRLQQQGRVYHFLKNSTRDSLCVCVSVSGGGTHTRCLPLMCAEERERAVGRAGEASKRGGRLARRYVL